MKQKQEVAGKTVREKEKIQRRCGVLESCTLSGIIPLLRVRLGLLGHCAFKCISLEPCYSFVVQRPENFQISCEKMVLGAVSV